MWYVVAARHLHANVPDVQAPVVQSWYIVLQRYVTGHPYLIPLKMIALDQLVFSPISLCIFLLLLRRLEGRSNVDNWHYLRRDFWTIYTTGLEASGIAMLCFRASYFSAGIPQRYCCLVAKKLCQFQVSSNRRAKLATRLLVLLFFLPALMTILDTSIECSLLLQIWPFVQIVKFYLIPLNYRLVAAQAFALVWNTFVAYQARIEQEQQQVTEYQCSTK